MHPARFFHLASFVEAGTWALLIGSMLTRALWCPELGATLVSWAGSAHGTAFVTYLFAVVSVALWAKWPVWAYVAGVASAVLPFTSLVFDWFARTRLSLAPYGSTRQQTLATWTATHPITLACASIALFAFVLGSTLGS